MATEGQTMLNMCTQALFGDAEISARSDDGTLGHAAHWIRVLLSLWTDALRAAKPSPKTKVDVDSQIVPCVTKLIPLLREF